MTLTWVSVDARTGLIGPDLADFAPQGPIAVTIGQYETLSATLPLPADVIAWADNQVGDAPLGQLDDWRSATRPGASVAVALDENDAPIWGGLILQRTTDHTARASLSLATMEAYLDRRYVGDKTYAATGENDIVADLIGSFIDDGTLPGIPIRVQASGANTPRDQEYLDVDDKTVYSVLQAALGQGHPEWTIGWERQHAPERITPVLFVAARIGTAAPAGLGPASTFSLPGSIITAELVEDYSSGLGANRVTATTGQGADRLAATVDAADFAGRPLYEYRWSPTDSITDVPTLTAHGQRALAILAPGTSALAITADIDEAPVLGTDWHLGDDIGYDLIAPAWIDGALASTGGINRIARCISWQRDDTTVRPILAVPDLGAA
jgi:hypothetical protein